MKEGTAEGRKDLTCQSTVGRRLAPRPGMKEDQNEMIKE
jgi:hypothetical protein